MLGLAVYTGEAESRDLFLLLVQTLLLSHSSDCFQIFQSSSGRRESVRYRKKILSFTLALLSGESTILVLQIPKLVFVCVCPVIQLLCRVFNLSKPLFKFPRVLLIFMVGSLILI